MDDRSDLYDVLPEDIVTGLISMGFDTRAQVVKSTYAELYPTPGLRKKDIRKVKEACRDPLDKALDPFYVVGKALMKTFVEDYPNNSVVINFNENKITVGDFKELFRAYKNSRENK